VLIYDRPDQRRYSIEGEYGMGYEDFFPRMETVFPGYTGPKSVEDSVEQQLKVIAGCGKSDNGKMLV